MDALKKPIRMVLERALPSTWFSFVEHRHNKVSMRMEEVRWRWSHNGRTCVRRLRRLHNRHRGQRCFVIGNGPSLKQMDLRPLANEVTIGSNGIFLLFDTMGFQPTYYTVEDKLVAEDRSREIAQLRGMTKIFPFRLAYCLTPDADTTYLNFRYEHFDEKPRFSPRLDRIVFWGGTVTYLNLQLACFLGCTDIYLIGVDHSYKVPPPEEIDKEFVIVSKSDDMNHFHPDYFGKGYRWHDPMVERMERAYLAAREYGEAAGIRIRNATVGGKLEVFQRVRYEELIQGKVD